MGDWTGGGLTGSGTNDTAALEALIVTAPAGSTIVFERGKRYRLNPMTITKTLKIDLNESTIVTSTRHAGTDAPLFGFTGSVVATQAASGTIFGNGLTANATTGSAFASGDWVVLGDSSDLLKWDTGVAFATGREFLTQLSGVSGSTLSLSTPAPWNLSVSPTVRKVAPLMGPEVSNGTIEDSDPGNAPVTGDGIYGSRADLISFTYTVRPKVSGIKVTGWQGVAIKVRDSYGAEIDQCYGEGAFRPTTGGCGHFIRFIRSSDSTARACRTIGARHLVTHVQSVRCGTEGCRAERGTGGASFQTHGWDSLDCFSRNDTAAGESTGWAHGNAPYGPDGAFIVDGPTYTGSNGALVPHSKSRHFRLTRANLRVGGANVAIAVTGGAENAVIDASSGYVSSASTGAAIRAEAGEGGIAVGAMTVIGDNFFSGGAISISIGGVFTCFGTRSSRVTVAASSASRTVYLP